MKPSIERPRSCRRKVCFAQLPTLEHDLSVSWRSFFSPGIHELPLLSLAHPQLQSMSSPRSSVEVAKLSSTINAASKDPLQFLQSPEICVICLDRVSEKAACLPCHHDQFDFLCLVTWLQKSQVCPLCKQKVSTVRCDASGGQPQVFHLPVHDLPCRSNSDIRQRRSQRESPSQRGNHSEPTDIALVFRRNIYRNQLYSLHVGGNRISGYRNISHSTFSSDSRLITKARMFVRRELKVFEFLSPDSASFGATDRRATNAEYLLEFIVAILQAIDIKGSTGQAEELLKDYLGRANAKLFLHELEAWLRSPYEKLEDWDAAVQYAKPTTASDKAGQFS